jgi:hypothetical protein
MTCHWHHGCENASEHLEYKTDVWNLRVRVKDIVEECKWIRSVCWSKYPLDQALYTPWTACKGEFMFWLFSTCRLQRRCWISAKYNFKERILGLSPEDSTIWSVGGLQLPMPAKILFRQSPHNVRGGNGAIFSQGQVERGILDGLDGWGEVAGACRRHLYDLVIRRGPILYPSYAAYNLVGIILDTYPHLLRNLKHSKIERDWITWCVSVVISATIAVFYCISIELCEIVVYR